MAGASTTSVTFTLANNTNVVFVPAGTSVAAPVTVANVDFAGGHELVYYLDGVAVGSQGDASAFTFTNVPFGQLVITGSLSYWFAGSSICPPASRRGGPAPRSW